MEVITIGILYITFIVAAALIQACVRALVVIGAVLLIISIIWGIYDRVKGRKRCDTQKETAEKQ